MDVREVGPRALLIEVESAAEAADLAGWLRAGDLAAPAGQVTEIVPAARTVLVDGVTDPGKVRALLAGFRPGVDATAGPVVEVPVVYDGPDLAFVADHWGVDAGEVIRRHTTIEFIAAFCGFAPGFAYLVGLPDDLAVPRLASPRARVEPGAVGLAGSFAGVYPSASPGGWRLIGRTGLRLWEPERTPPARLAPGTRVRFVEVDR